jgi:hypothetical protein
VLLVVQEWSVPKLFSKTLASLKTEGVSTTLTKIVRYPIVRYPFTLNGKFSGIYQKNMWTSEESVSGPGSTLEYTINLRRTLPAALNTYSINTIFDAPCGDFNWMRDVIKDTNITYVGGDIVRALIKANNLAYGDSNISFIRIDLTKEIFPESDLMICRDFLFHCSFRHTKLVLRNFVRSKIQYLFTTTHINTGQFKNEDISTGASYRLIDLFAPPYCFPRDVLFRVEDWIAPYPKREMCLWTREQIIQALTAWKT